MATYKEIKGVTVQTRDEDPVENVEDLGLVVAALNTARIPTWSRWHSNCRLYIWWIAISWCNC